MSNSRKAQVTATQREFGHSNHSQSEISDTQTLQTALTACGQHARNPPLSWCEKICDKICRALPMFLTGTHLSPPSDAVIRWPLVCITERRVGNQKGIAMGLVKPLTFVPAFLFVVACAYGQEIHYNYDRGTTTCCLSGSRSSGTRVGRGGAAAPGGVVGALGVSNHYRVQQPVRPLTSGLSSSVSMTLLQSNLFGLVLPARRSIPARTRRRTAKTWIRQRKNC